MSAGTHLFDAGGRWIAWYRDGQPYVWNRHDQWIGWFPWAGDDGDAEARGDVVDPYGQYLGTVVGDRLLSKSFRVPRPLPDGVPEPSRPVGAPNREQAVGMTPPTGYEDVPAQRLDR